MPERAFQQDRALPRHTIFAPGCITEVQIQIVIFDRDRGLAAVPRAGVHK